MADPNPPPAAKLQEFQRAVSQKDDNATLRLLREFPVLLDRHLDSSGRTGLMHAAHNGRCNPLRALLRRGAAVDIQTGSGATAAWYAAAANKPTALRILLRHGADPMAFVLEAGNRHRSIFDVAMEKGHADILEVLHSFLTSYHVRKCRRLVDDYLVLSAQGQAPSAAAAVAGASQQEEEEVDGCGMCTQSAGSEDEEEGEEEEGPPPPQMARPGYLSLRPGEGAVGMPTVTVTTAAALQAMVEEEEGRMEEGRVRSAKRRRRRRAGGMRAAAELEAARAAVEFVLNGMDPQLWNGFSALMG